MSMARPLRRFAALSATSPAGAVEDVPLKRQDVLPCDAGEVLSGAAAKRRGQPPRRTLFMAAAFLIAACAPAAGVKAGVDAVAVREAALSEAMAADKAFSDYAQTAGMGEAFARYMDAVDGRIVGPGEVTQGEAAIRAAFKDWPADLHMTWAPDMGFGSAGGDLAVTSGRWARTRNGATVAEGRYVTVWRKGADGEWKGVIDIGAPDPAKPATGVPTPDKPDLEGRPG